MSNKITLTDAELQATATIAAALVQGMIDVARGGEIIDIPLTEATKRAALAVVRLRDITTDD